MRYLKKMALVCMVAAGCCTLHSVQASADELDKKLSIFDGSTLIDGDYAENQESVLARGSILSHGVSKIEDKGGRKVAVGGITSCYVYCDKVICNLYLEQLDEDGHWYTYKFWNLYTTNASEYMPTKVVSVEGGHWYRARGGHVAEDNGTRESVSTKTDGIYIS